MRISIILFCLVLFQSCNQKVGSHNFSQVKIEPLFTDSLSIRAIEIMDGSLAFAANKGTYGLMDLKTNAIKTNSKIYDSIIPEFRAVAHTTSDFFMLSVGSPALLFKTGDNGQMQLVYQETGDGVFYDAMTFWNDMEGIAIGDSVGGCLSIIITRDGGHNWKKIPCDQLPEGRDKEGAFAASNTNVVTKGNKAWIVTTSATVYYTKDKGNHWEIFNTPIVNSKATQGIYSIDFYDEDLGFVIGGDFTDPENKDKNKALTTDGGKTWHLVANGLEPEYKSCVQFVPNSGGEDLIALGFTGISYSKDKGKTWTSLSEESFYTLRFLNDSVAYAAGKNKISKLTFK
ncbi:WD40/YVTN/BNR-like repeat-containing protein [Spongiimicrobium sp. 3-5]|uniref:WD40/YVTN/BNR-like repeat-containing protein n=1 Tax=Spongiimicrobium sp. 3-5 TaxID=3332596 RepID=UPI00397F2BE3